MKEVSADLIYYLSVLIYYLSVLIYYLSVLIYYLSVLIYYGTHLVKVTVKEVSAETSSDPRGEVLGVAVVLFAADDAVLFCAH